MGIGGSIVLLPTVFAACSDGDDDCGENPTAPNCGSAGATLDLSNDTGILNYAYALEQLEAAFYTAVVASAAFGGMTAEQREVLTDLRDHEVIHREFFRRVLGGNAIGTALKRRPLYRISSSANLLRSRRVRGHGVAEYNGGESTSPGAPQVAGKIVSSKHARRGARELREGSSLVVPGQHRFAGATVVNASDSTSSSSERGAAGCRTQFLTTAYHRPRPPAPRARTSVLPSTRTATRLQELQTWEPRHIIGPSPRAHGRSPRDVSERKGQDSGTVIGARLASVPWRSEC